MQIKKHAVTRVLMIFSNSYDGAYPRELAHGFYNEGIEIGFISLSKAKAPSWVDTHHAKEFSGQFGPDVSILKKVLNTINVIRSFKPSVIQTHLFLGGIVGFVAAKLARVPVIHTRHHIDEHYQSGTTLHRWLDRVIAKKSDHVIVCSQAAKNWLVEVEKVREEDITVINQGFDFSFLSPTDEDIEMARRSLDFSKDDLNIVCVSRYSKAKGQNYLLLALKEIIKTVPQVSLKLMGPGDSTWLVKLVDELELNDFVDILPARTDVPACIAAADMVIHPSLADSFSQLVIEAQAVGGLLVATNIAAAREQIVDGVTGLIIPARDPKAIVEAVLYLVNHPDVAKSMRERGPSHVRERFAWQRMVAEEISCINRFN
jgi:glycosyltransferase involved in cell wall biosynthesis